MNQSQSQLQIRVGTHLPIMEQFYTIQGEGFHTGKAAYFVRIGGCDVGCHWCDVKESWEADKHPVTEISSVVSTARKHSNTVVITGGEPLMWDMTLLTQSLKAVQVVTHLETSGAYPMTGTWDWICLSPKKRKEVQADIYPLADELKVIIYNDSDFDFAEQHLHQLSNHCKCYLQPEWSRRESMMPKIVDYVMKHPQWQVSLQTHKYLNIP